MDLYIQIENSLKEFLSNYNFIIDEMGTSPRSVGDKVQEVITSNFPEICKKVAEQMKLEFKFNTEFSRRSFEDVAFSFSNQYLAFDVKTRNIEAEFHMPNIKSAERLIHFYSSNENVFVIVSTDYQLNLKDQKRPITFAQVTVVPIEQINWDCLRFGGLGYGQLQIEPNRPVAVNRLQTREVWMKEFFQKLISFYKEELKKSKTMVKWAEKCQDLWQEGKIHKFPRLRTYIIRETKEEYKTSGSD